MSYEPLSPDNHDQLPVDEHLYLKGVNESEAELFYGLVENNRLYLAEFLPWAKGNTQKDSLDFIRKVINDRFTGSEYGFGIYANDALVGHISLMHIDDEQEPEIGYWIDKGHSGLGITTKAADAVSRFGFEVLGTEAVIIKAAATNIASNKVAQKLGYHISGTEISDNGMEINIWRKTSEK